MAANTETKKVYKRKLEGVVTSNKNEKTIVVKVQRRFKDERYNKFVYRSKSYHAHDANNKAQEGDFVSIIESRPYSKLKKWELVEVKKAAITA